MSYKEKFEADRQDMFTYIDTLTADPLWKLKVARKHLYYCFFNHDSNYKAPINPLKGGDEYKVKEGFGERIAQFLRPEDSREPAFGVHTILSSSEQQLMVEYIKELKQEKKDGKRAFDYPEEITIRNKAFGKVLGDKYLDISMEHGKLALLYEQGMVTPEVYQAGLAHIGQQMDRYGFNGIDRMIKSNPELHEHLCATHPDFIAMQGKINAGEIAPEAVRWENALTYKGALSHIFEKLSNFWSSSLDSYKASERFDEVRLALNVETDRIMQGLESSNPETMFRARKLLFAKHGLALLDPEIAQSAEGIDVVMAGTQQAQGMARIQKMREHVKALVDQFSLPEYNFDNAVVRFGNVRKRLRGENTIVEALQAAAVAPSADAATAELKAPDTIAPQTPTDPPPADRISKQPASSATVEEDLSKSSSSVETTVGKSRHIPSRLVTSVASVALLYDGITHYNDKNETKDDASNKLLRGTETATGVAGLAASWLTKSTTIDKIVSHLR